MEVGYLSINVVHRSLEQEYFQMESHVHVSRGYLKNTMTFADISLLLQLHQSVKSHDDIKL